MTMDTHRTLLQIGPLPPGLEQSLRERYVLHPYWLEPDRAAFLRANAGRYSGAVTMSRHGCAAEVMQAVAGGVVACFGVGHDGIDLAAARRHGVAVSTTPDVLNACVADTALALMLSVARRIVDADRYVREGRWLSGAFGLGARVSGKRLGILGLGRIGMAIARRAEGFDMSVRYHGRKARADAPYGFEPDLRALARDSDFLVVACQGGEATRNLVDAPVLRALGPDGFLINIARGSVVDEPALVQALQEGAIGGAGLDVYAREPQVPPALIASERVVLLPHIAASTRETRAAMEALVMRNLQSFFETGRVLTPPV
ncbi:2-hydroxyacid dehydrogenase [Bordetella hinzii]|uniref:2-hydroxyacid dehydrogenase n=2 Tax=Bordetella hinzii TaxID=103855 RepID=UPI0013EFE6E4|nr:2-hydroxyacid dehydrogenase [Bordetella hinzii]